MSKSLGPRTLLVKRDDKFQEVSVVVTYKGIQRVDLGDDVFVDQLVGEVFVSSEEFSKRMIAAGADELQVVFYLLRLADAYLTRICTDRGLRLFSSEHNPIEGEFGSFA